MTVTTEYVAPVAARTVVRRPAPRVAGRDTTPVRMRSRVVSAAPSCVTAAPSVAVSSAVQLTRRGWTVLLGLATAVAAVLVWVAYLSHPGTVTPAAAPAGTEVVVQSGDTLWSIAERVAPGEDPRAVVWDLQHANHLDDPTVTPGQVLRVA